MKQRSVNDIKKGRDVDTYRLIPQDGTFIRSIHDRLLENRGLWIGFKTNRRQALSTAVAQLQDCYGMDIRKRRGAGRGPGKGCKPGKYRLVGEHIDGQYVSYITGD